MSDTFSANVVGALATVSPDDTISVETASQTWDSQDVVDVDRVEWRVPFGGDWLTGTLQLEGVRGAEYEIELDTGSDPPARLYHHGKRGGRNSCGSVLSVRDADVDTGYACDDCGEAFETHHALGAHCAHGCDGGGDETDDSPDVEFPDGITSTDVHDAVDTHEFLDDIAGALGITIGRARALVHSLDRYCEVNEARAGRGAYRGGGRR